MYCGMNIDISLLILLPMKQTSNRSIEINVDISYIIFPSIVFFYNIAYNNYYAL